MVVSPNDFDFGSVRLSCRSSVTAFTVRNLCASTVTVSAVGLSGSADFVATGIPTLPASLAAFGSQTFNVTYTPSVTGMVSTILVVGAQQNASSVVYQTLLTGTGSMTATTVEAYTVPLHTDTVLIIDNSGSMGDKQAALGSNGSALFAYPISAGTDFNLGVTTTDFEDGGTIFAPAGERGAFVSDAGPLVITNRTPGLLSVFNARVRAGVSGSGYEMMFAPSWASVTQPLVTTRNAGFLRTDATLSYLVVTDAADQSPGPVTAWWEALTSIKGWRQRNRLSFNVVGPTQATPTCTYDATGAGTDPRLPEMVRRTGGASAEICALLDAGTWAPVAQRMGQAVFGGRATWFLTATPPGGATGLSVSVGGVTLPEVNGATRNWSYNPTLNAVAFEANTLPAPGQSVAFSYTPACMP